MCKEMGKILPSDFIKFGKFKKEIFYATQVEMSDETREIFLKYGRSYIINDEEKIIDYAINKMLKDSIPYFNAMKKVKKEYPKCECKGNHRRLV